MILQTHDAATYANQLLSDLGESRHLEALLPHPALAFRRSGLLHITGNMLPLPLASHADGALMALKALASQSSYLPEFGSQLLGERARLRDIVCEGRICAGGHGRLIDMKDGRLALNLAREDDWDLVPAWLEGEADGWDDIERLAKQKDTAELVSRAAEMGLACAEDKLPPKPDNWFTLQHFETSNPKKKPLIVDLSSLWAGPLASNLLNLTGAKVIKIESPSRPDGARGGHKGFYELLNAGKDCVALNFRDAEDLKKLKTLLNKADIVIEASRPRALQQLGIIAEEYMAQMPGKIWARLTAYGQSDNRIGYGDDIGVAAGLASIMEQTHGNPSFAGDAIADPVNGLHLALAIQAKLKQGGGVIIDMSMRDVLRYAIGDISNDLKAVSKAWQNICAADTAKLYPIRKPIGQTKALGADNGVWL